MPGQTYEGWIAAFTTNVTFEADIVRDRLADAGLSAVIMNKRDTSVMLNFGDNARINVMVPPDQVEEARALLAEAPISDAELDSAAMNAAPASDTVDPDAPEAMADTGNESIHLTTPDAE
ncbi:MAG: DUF2007 domain-containing protein [Rhodothermales bacterium]